MSIETNYINLGDNMRYDFIFFENAIKALETEKRFNHTLGVQKEAYELGNIFLPNKAYKLQLSGLLHDITKDFSLEKQLKLCEKYNVSIDKNNIVPKLLHAKTGCEYARELFGKEVIDDEIYSAIYYHTTGRNNMSLFEAIIYLADYIESGRTFEDCVLLRNYFYDNIKNANSFDDKLEILRKTMVLSFDLTIKNLIEENKQIDMDTIEARNYFLTNKSVFKNDLQEE